ncbi:hypothetical protein F4703DRAFT_1833847 [Phycomyces blakesleeanus]
MLVVDLTLSVFSITDCAVSQLLYGALDDCEFSKSWIIQSRSVTIFLFIGVGVGIGVEAGIVVVAGVGVGFVFALLRCFC